MALRKQSPSIDPDVEASRAELDTLEGAKNTAQQDVLVIAENKKRLESDKEETIKRLDDEIAGRQKDSEDASIAHAQLISRLSKEKEDAEKARDTAVQNKETAEQDAVTAQKQAADEIDKKKVITDSIAALMTQEAAIRRSVKNAALDLERDETRSTEVKKELADIEAKLMATKDEHNSSVESFASEKKEHETLLTSKEAKQKEITILDASITDKNTKLTALTAEVTILENKRSEHETVMKQREDDANKRMANATNLEQRVDGKLEQLKEAEKEFTTDHLARMGYRPIGT